MPGKPATMHSSRIAQIWNRLILRDEEFSGKDRVKGVANYGEIATCLLPDKTGFASAIPATFAQRFASQKAKAAAFLSDPSLNARTAAESCR